MPMKTFMKDNGMKVKETGMECSQRETEITSKVIGLMTREKDKVHTTSVRKTSCLLENGLTTNQSVEFIPKLKTKMLLPRKRNLISLINTLYLIFPRFSLQIQQDYLKELWKL